MKQNDRVVHNNFGIGTVIAIRNYEVDKFNRGMTFPILVEFDETLRQIWCREKDLQKVKVRKLEK